MSVPTIELSGKALVGIAPHLLTAEQRAALPVQVKLGRIRPPVPPKVVRLDHHLYAQSMTAPPPTTTNRRDKAAQALARMYMNNVLGCCVWASYLHFLGLTSANDSDSAGMVQATDPEVQQQYVAVCGPGDRGCVITDVLDYARSHGVTAGGKVYRLDGYVSVDWTNQLEVQTAIYLFGAIKLGFNLPQAWQSANVWDVTNTPIVGGHDVPIVDVTPDGPIIASWGRLYLMTWRALQSPRFVEEAYVMLDPTWYGKDQQASACGLDVAGLKADLATIGQGQVPPIPDPNPTPPPTPPPPPAPGSFNLPASGTYTMGVTTGGKVKMTFN